MMKGTKTMMTQKSRKEQQAIKLISMVSDNDTANLIYEMSGTIGAILCQLSLLKNERMGMS